MRASRAARRRWRIRDRCTPTERVGTRRFASSSVGPGLEVGDPARSRPPGVTDHDATIDICVAVYDGSSFIDQPRLVGVLRTGGGGGLTGVVHLTDPQSARARQRRRRAGGLPMDKIIPRWEWRTFGPSFGPAEAQFAALEPTGIQESDELYLLSGMGDNVKVRDDLMDIKVFVETDAAGLEPWRPV